MKRLQIKEILMPVKGELIKGKEEASFNNVSRMSTEGNKDTLFFFLIGDRINGHEYIEDVVKIGVKSLVISDESYLAKIEKYILEDEELNIILVEDTKKAMQDLAKYYLEVLAPKVVGITGSVGKTTTKDILFQIVNSKYKAGKTMGNYNNKFGLPLSILALEEGTEVAILEMGTSEAGNIKLLADLARPSVAIVTTIGTSHIETLGTRENILIEKLSITSYFENDDTLIYFPDDYLKQEKINCKAIAVKKENGRNGDLIVKNIKNNGEKGSEFTIEYDGKNEKFKLDILGNHNVINCALAIGAALKCGVTLEEAKKSINKLDITKGRLSIKEKKGVKIIDDTYNASPMSVKAGIDVLMSMEGKRKVAFLGDMLELGEFSENSHYEIGDYARERGVDLLVAIGEESKKTYEGWNNINKTIDETRQKVIHYIDKEEVLLNLQDLVEEGDVILFKGSRGMKLEKIIENL